MSYPIKMEFNLLSKSIDAGQPAQSTGRSKHFAIDKFSSRQRPFYVMIHLFFFFTNSLIHSFYEFLDSASRRCMEDCSVFRILQTCKNPDLFGKVLKIARSVHVLFIFCLVLKFCSLPATTILIDHKVTNCHLHNKFHTIDGVI